MNGTPFESSGVGLEEREEEIEDGCGITAIEIAVAALLILAKLLVSLLEADPG